MSDPWVENKVVVNIFGEDYPITGVSNSPYISRVADYVDAKMKEVAENNRTGSRDRVAILAAMSIASELFESSGELNRVQKNLDFRAESILGRLDEAISE
ncbi:MAG: cell division protein ZapA [candidate division Zixibacteria bacterium]|nr:cell division protein ZapA [candidate division Zixibacteria bacterium]